MKIHLIAPALPPKLDGIGDHSAQLAAALADAGAEVTILAPIAPAGSGLPAAAVRGVRIVPAFSPHRRSSVWKLTDLVAADQPDWVLLQYNPFSYGARGLNLSLPRAFAAMKKSSAATRLSIFVHERSVPRDNLKLAIMAAWQQWQYSQLCRAADVIFTSIDRLATEGRLQFPGKPFLHVPVGSNVPRIPITRTEARARLQIEDGISVLGMFGQSHVSRLLDPIRNALDAAAAAGFKPMLLYIGPNGDWIRSAIPNHRLIADGPLPADEVSRRLSAVDISLSAFEDGVSTRRGSFFAALQHGLACIATSAYNTDAVFKHANDTGSIILTDATDLHGFDRPVIDLLRDPARAESMRKDAVSLSSREFAWDRLAAKVLAGLHAYA